MGQTKFDGNSNPRHALEVLLVEDSPGDATLVSELMKDGGFFGRIHWVTDGAEALDYVFRRGRHVLARLPDVVLLDLNLPKMDGREVLKELRCHPPFSSLPVVILTTSNRPEDILECNAFLVGAYLVKPRDLYEYEALVQRLLQVEFPRLIEGRDA